MNHVDPDRVLGDELRAARLAAGLTCELAARWAGIGAARLVGVEDGDGQLPFTDVLPLLHVYGISLAAFATGLELELRRRGRDQEVR